jgi:bacteriorhodopsin
VGWTPIIIALGLVSGVSWSTIVYNIALSWTWIATWLAGALTGTDYKWGFWTFGIFAYFLLSISLLNNGFITSERLGIRKQYLALSSYLVFFWLLYPIASGLDDYGNKIAVTDGFIFFGILDLFTVPFFTLAILALSTRWDYRTLNIYFTQYGRVAQAGEIPERIEREKAAEAAAAGGAAAEPEQTV